MIATPPLTAPGAWPYWLGALAIAICSAETAFYRARGPESYPQLTLGSITWHALGKRADFALPVGFMAGFVVAWLVLQLVERRVERRLGADGVSSLRGLVAYASLPFVIWAASLVLGTNPIREMVWVSAVAVAAAAALMLRATWTRHDTAAHAAHGTQDTQDTQGADSADGSHGADDADGALSPLAPGHAAGLVLLTTLFGALSALIGVFAINRWNSILWTRFVWNGDPSPLLIATVGASVALAAGLAVWGTGRTSARSWAALLIVAQAILPWAFLNALPTPWRVGAAVMPAIANNGALLFVLALIAATYGDLARRWWRISRGREPGRGRGDDPLNALYALSPLALAAALLFIKVGPLMVGELDHDDYHFGEQLLPWWSLVTHGAVPFWDHVPARGLVNYLGGAVASLTFGNTAAGITAATGLVSTMILIAGLTSLSRVIGVLPAAAAFLCMPVVAQWSQIDIIVSAAFALLIAAYARYGPSAWLVWWTAVSILMVMWAPAQGSALVLATMPLGGWQAIRAWRHERPTLWRFGGIAAVVLLVLLAATPLGKIVFGALRYGVEHGAVSSVAHGTNWSLSLPGSLPLSLLLFEALATSWILVGLVAAVFVMSAWLHPHVYAGRREIILIVGVPIALLAVFFIYRTLGRIGGITLVSRQGSASVWFLTLLLPMLLHAAWGARRWPAIVTLVVAGGGLLTPAIEAIDVRAIAARPREAIKAPFDTSQASQLGLRTVGPVRGHPGHLQALSEIKRILDILLDKDETYLDLTNWNAHYYYVERRLPIEVGAYYNLPNERQLLRAIRTLEQNPVPVVLGVSVNHPLYFDAGKASLRAHALYRYLIWRYVPVKVGEHIFLVKPDRLARLQGHAELTVDQSNPLALFDDVFHWSDFHGLALAWGRSWPSLQSSVTEVRTLGDPTPIGATAAGQGTYDVPATVTGDAPEAAPAPGPVLRWDLSPLQLAGKTAGLLTFDFVCVVGPGPMRLEVSWAEPGDGSPQTTVSLLVRQPTTRPDDGPPPPVNTVERLAVPLDASPRWLLAPAIGQLEIRLARTATNPETDVCTRFSITNVKLWQRRVAAVADRP